ncbi:Hypothetical predicted protein [Octopus vulgaris]|uniref:Uncharacterized protein n=1 Tax=Octopus vulgaris TaxID=6645 RepID=A0AA36B4M2_OCTVU|nr:Hypothetical predicted protein [Octopus vulgaris]
MREQTNKEMSVEVPICFRAPINGSLNLQQPHDRQGKLESNEVADEMICTAKAAFSESSYQQTTSWSSTA